MCIIGLDYVGLRPSSFCKKYDVVGFDRTLELSKEQLLEVKDTITYSYDLEDIKDANIYIVTVPTPINSSNRPDLTPLVKPSQMIGKVLILKLQHKLMNYIKVLSKHVLIKQTQ